jgi:hypothetical protein
MGLIRKTYLTRNASDRMQIADSLPNFFTRALFCWILLVSLIFESNKISKSWDACIVVTSKLRRRVLLSKSTTLSRRIFSLVYRTRNENITPSTTNINTALPLLSYYALHHHRPTDKDVRSSTRFSSLISSKHKHYEQDGRLLP